MPCEPGPPASSPAPSSNCPEDFVGNPFLPEGGDGNAESGVTSDALDLLSVYFPSETEANDITHEQIDRVMPAAIKTAKSESVDFGDLRGQLQQTELVVKQSVRDAGAFRTELAQLREVAVRLTGEYHRIEEATRAAEERSVAAANGQAVVLADLRGQLQQTELAIKQSVGEAGAVKTELAQLREVAMRLTAEYNVLQDLSRGTEARLAAQNVLADQMTRKADEATLQLAQLAKVKNEVESDLARFENRVETLRRRATRAGGSRVFRVLSAAVMSAGWNSLTRWLTQVMTVLQRQKTPQLIRHHRAVIGRLGVLVLAGFVVTRSLGDVDRIGGQPLLTHAQPVLPASILVLPEVMLRTAGPILPQPLLSTARPTVRTANSTAQRQPKTQPLLKGQSPPVSQPRANARSPQTQVRSREFIGTLEVQSDPTGAAVLINRQRVGETPLQLPQLRAGSHVIWIEREGYQRWTAAARVVADTVTRVNVKLQPEPARPGIQ